MLEHAAEPGNVSDLSLAGARAVSVSPFEDIAAVHALYEAKVFRFLLFSLRDRDVALSLTQDTFLNAWKARASFRGDCAVLTWLMRIAVNLVRNHTRTEGFKFWKRAAATAVDVMDPGMQLVHTGASAETWLAARQQMELVWSSVEKLSARQRMIFLLRFVDEMELSEIVVATGLSLPTVKSHLYRALDHVRADVRGNARAKESEAR